MAKSAGQKLKLLYVLDYLKKHSDENHPVTTGEIIEMLERNGIHAERKSIYDDVASLVYYGYDIISLHSRSGGGYYLGAREFEVPELKLLADAVSSSKFVTAKKSRELIEKLENFVSENDAVKLKRQVYVTGRVKTENENIYYSVDCIHHAIQDDKQITFTYLEWNMKKELVPRKNGYKKVSPWALIWQDENYYLAAYDSEDGIIKHYRVDKMGKVNVTKDKREGFDIFGAIDISAYSRQTFGMFAGEEDVVSLKVENRLLGVVLDRFGKDVDIRPLEEGYFKCRVRVAVSVQFFGWLFGLVGGVEILEPQKIRNSYVDYLETTLEKYR